MKQKRKKVESQKSLKGRKSGKAMQMQLKRFLNNVLLFLLIPFFLLNCGDQKEASKAPVISKKIAVQKPPQPDKKSDQASGDSSAESPEIKGSEKKGSVAQRIYDPKERIDPFIPLFKAENKETATDQIGKTKRKKRIPQTPLERVSINQLKLVAVIRASTGNRGLVEDNSGKGYIIKNGTYIGLNSGIVTQINADSVIVEEELENLMGELILQNTEIKLQKPAGE
jgi:type IV pilus assembly protein PilP